jgi:hypothetical protein
MMGYTVSAVQISANRRTAFLLAQALIHPSAWKENSTKLGVAISPASALVGSCSASEGRSLRFLDQGKPNL